MLFDICSTIMIHLKVRTCIFCFSVYVVVNLCMVRLRQCVGNSSLKYLIVGVEFIFFPITSFFSSLESFLLLHISLSNSLWEREREREREKEREREREILLNNLILISNKVKWRKRLIRIFDTRTVSSSTQFYDLVHYPTQW